MVAFRGDADDGEGMAVELNRFAEDAGTASKALLPILVAKNDQRILARYPAFVGSKGAPARGFQTEHGEVVAGDQFRPSAFRAAFDAEVQGTRGIGDQVGKNGFELAIVLEIGVGEAKRKIHATDFGRNDDDLLGVLDGERAPKHAVENAED